MTLEKQIELLKEWHERAEMYLPIMSSEDIDRFLHWLEDYKQLKADYADLDNKLRTANTENDRLRSVSSWHSCDEKPPERITYLVTDGYCVYLGYYAVSEKHWTTEEDTDGNSLLYWMPIPKPPKE